MKLQNIQVAYEQFCKTVNDFELVPQNRSKVIICYSGGKDASLLVDLFVMYKNNVRPDLRITLLTASFPEMIYNSNDPEQRKCVKDAIDYWEQRGCTHKMLGLPYGVGDHLFDGKDVPCELCESMKTKIILNELSKDEYSNSLVCSGHTVEDIAGYFLELFYLTGRYENWIEVRDKNPKLFIRAMELSWKVYPKFVLQSNGNNIMNIKPLIELEEDLIKSIKDEGRYIDIPECCAKVRGEKFKMYKRYNMQGLEMLRKRYQSTSEIYDNMIFKSYRNLVRKYKAIGLIPDIKEIEEMNLESKIIGAQQNPTKHST